MQSAMDKECGKNVYHICITIRVSLTCVVAGDTIIFSMEISDSYSSWRWAGKIMNKINVIKPETPNGNSVNVSQYGSVADTDVWKSEIKTK